MKIEKSNVRDLTHDEKNNDSVCFFHSFFVRCTRDDLHSTSHILYYNIAIDNSVFIPPNQMSVVVSGLLLDFQPSKY